MHSKEPTRAATMPTGDNRHFSGGYHPQMRDGKFVSRQGSDKFALLRSGFATDTGALDLLGTLVPFKAESAFFGEDDAAQYVYRLVSGIARGYHITSEGRRQIVAFYVPGDIFGIEYGERHKLHVDALTDGRVQMIKRAVLASIAQADPCASEQLRANMARELHRDHGHILRLSTSAKERVASFLIEMSERLSTNGTVQLPMSRQEIAEYLGLTIETVSRSLSQLKAAAIISTTGARKITILDQRRLRQITL